MTLRSVLVSSKSGLFMMLFPHFLLLLPWNAGTGSVPVDATMLQCMGEHVCLRVYVCAHMRVCMCDHLCTCACACVYVCLCVW